MMTLMRSQNNNYVFFSDNAEKRQESGNKRGISR